MMSHILPFNAFLVLSILISCHFSVYTWSKRLTISVVPPLILLRAQYHQHFSDLLIFFLLCAPVLPIRPSPTSSSPPPLGYINKRRLHTPFLTLNLFDSSLATLTLACCLHTVLSAR